MVSEGEVARWNGSAEHEVAEPFGVLLAARAREGHAPEERLAHAMFRRRGEYWEIAYAGELCLLRDRKGMRYLAELLRHPWQEFHALDLCAPALESDEAVLRAATRRLRRDLGAVLDPHARAAYRDSLRELQLELDAARAANDPGRATRAQHEMESVTRELTRAVGLGGHPRRAGSAAERARVNVSRAISAALKCIMEHHPIVGNHLATTIRTGTYCFYAPNPRTPIEWTL